MFDIGIGEVDLTTLIALAAFFVVLPLQFLLCFKAKNLLVRRLPSIILAVATISFFAMMSVSRDWDAVGYAIFAVFSGSLLIITGIVWGIWSIVSVVQKKRAVNGK